MILRLLLVVLLLTGSGGVRADSGMVSAADPHAAEAGRAILRQGGSAVDAALATMLALTVVEPQSSGIGGGGFLVTHDARTGEVRSFDGRETAPAAAGPRWFFAAEGTALSRRNAVPGGRSVGVPGNFRLMEIAHQRHGRLRWAALFAPAIRLARKGYLLSPRGYNSLLRAGAHIDGAWARRIYFGPDGRPKPVGTRIRNPELARLLATIARRGPDHFYVGAPARSLVAAVNGARRNPSRMSMGDLASYDAKERAPVCGTYRRHRVCGMGPPSSGATTVFAILKQLEGFDLARMGSADPAAWHLIAQSMRLAYADREAYLADADYVIVPVAGLMEPSYLTARSRQIAADRAIAEVRPGTPAGAPPRLRVPANERASTSHLVAVDRFGNVASLTSTIEGPFGSGLTVDGYFLNNELTDFDIAPERDGALVANRVEGGKRPRSSMSPTIVYAPDGRVRLAIGAAGGATIIAQVAKAIVGVVDWKLTAKEAIALPLIYAPGDRVLIEKGTRLETMAPALAALGNQVTAIELPLKANAIERVGGAWRGAADPRSEGVALAE